MMVPNSNHPRFAIATLALFATCAVHGATLTVGPTVQVSSNHSPFNVSVYPGAAGFDDGVDSGTFGDGTVLDYRFFTSSGTNYNGVGYANGGGGRVSTNSASNTSQINGGPLPWAKVWTTNDPGTNFTGSAANFTVGTLARSQGIDGTIDISGLTAGTIYFIYGTYFNPNILTLTMTGPGQPDVVAMHTEDPPNTVNFAFITEFAFDDASAYDTIAYHYRNTDTDGSRARFMGAILDSTGDLRLTKTASVTNVFTGGNFTYTLDILNGATTALGGIVVTDSLPAEVAFLSSTPAADLTNGTDFVFNLGTLGPGSNAVITINVSAIAAGPTDIVNRATAITTNLNTFPRDAAAVAVTPITTIQDILELTKIVSSTNLLAGTNLTYTILVTNRSPEAAFGVEVTDTFPTGLVFVSSVPPADQTNGNQYTYLFGTMASGASTSILLNATLAYTGPAVFTNVAITVNTNGEIITVNNQDTVRTVVWDTDGDGISNPFDPDDDNDRMPDDAEIIAGTLPLDNTSYLWLRIAKTTNLQVRQLKFPGVVGRTYRIQGATNLYTGPWQDVQTNIPGINGLMNTFRTNSLQQLYYRVGVETP